MTAFYLEIIPPSIPPPLHRHNTVKNCLSISNVEPSTIIEISVSNRKYANPINRPNKKRWCPARLPASIPETRQDITYTAMIPTDTTPGERSNQYNKNDMLISSIAVIAYEINKYFNKCRFKSLFSKISAPLRLVWNPSFLMYIHNFIKTWLFTDIFYNLLLNVWRIVKQTRQDDIPF